MKRLLPILLTAFLILSCSSPVYDVVVVGGGPAGIGAALAGAERVRADDKERQPGSYFFWISSKGLDFDADEVNRAYQEAIASGEMLPTDVYVGMSWFIQKGLENVQLVHSASEVGVRETWRIVGEKTITEEDYLAGIVPEDALAAFRRCDPREVPLEEIKTSLSGIGHLVAKE